MAITFVDNKKKLVFGDSVKITLSTLSGNSGEIEELSLNGKILNVDSILPQEITLDPVNKLGKNTLLAKAKVDNKVETSTASFTIISDIEPENFSFKVVNTFPHDQKAYTQGFVINQGVWFEGTGGQGVSDIRKVNKSNGKVILGVPLEDRYFGEGITIHKNKMYQLTWKAQTGFIYEPSSLVREKSFFYEGEGWGITSDSNHLIMSNGSNVLKFLNDQTWAVERKIHVYDNKGPVTFLNELEYIDGHIWANVWQQEHIVVIDPITGRVTQRIKLKGILKRNGFPNAEVLNGIAWDSDKRELFVTGKYWPFIYQIESVPAPI